MTHRNIAVNDPKSSWKRELANNIGYDELSQECDFGLFPLRFSLQSNLYDLESQQYNSV